MSANPKTGSRSSHSVSVVSSKSIKQVQLDNGFWSKRLITGPTTDSKMFMMSLVSLDAGATSTDCYRDKDEALFIIKGSLAISWNKHRKKLSPGDSVFIPMETTTTIQNTDKRRKAQLLAIIAPSKTMKELQWKFS
jgi:mannose-6-phosphate isomerase-like protein (cupin superfamily)